MGPKKGRGRAASKRTETSTTSSVRSSIDEEKRNQIRVAIKDFDKQVEDHLGQMSRESELFIDKVGDIHRFEFLRIPKRIRDLNWGKFLVSDDLTANEEAEDQVPEFVAPAEPPPKKRTATTTTTQKRTTSKTRRGGAARMDAETPLSSKDGGWPVITPKANPLRAFTNLGTLRKPKFNEVLWSAKGSPVNANETVKSKVLEKNEGGAAVLVQHNGMVLELTNSPVDAADCPQLDEDGVKQLEELKRKISVVLQHNQNKKQDNNSQSPNK